MPICQLSKKHSCLSRLRCPLAAVPLGNNVSELEMKRVVLTKKNSLFVGNARGGRTAAILGEPDQHLLPA